MVLLTILLLKFWLVNIMRNVTFGHLVFCCLYFYQESLPLMEPQMMKFLKTFKKESIKYQAANGNSFLRKGSIWSNQCSNMILRLEFQPKMRLLIHG